METEVEKCLYNTTAFCLIPVLIQEKHEIVMTQGNGTGCVTDSSHSVTRSDSQ